MLTRAKKSKGKSEDDLAKRLFTGSQSETGSETSPVKTAPQKTPMKTPKAKKTPKKVSASSKKESTLKDSEQSVAEEQQDPPAQTPRQVEKTPKTKSKKKLAKEERKASDSGQADPEVMASDGEDDVISFNLEAKSSKKASKTPQTGAGAKQPKKSAKKQSQATSPLARKAKSTEVKTPPAVEKLDLDSEAREPAQDAEKTESAPGVEDAVGEAAAAKEQRDTQPRETKGKKRKNRKRKGPPQENNVPAKKLLKSDKDIFFYCGNLPPGVTLETLRYYLEEEGIHPKITLHKKKNQGNNPKAKLTAKEKKYKKNIMMAAKSMYARVIVKTEEEALKMAALNGVSMPSPSHLDVETELKIVRRLPRPEESAYKVYIGGLNQRINDEELKLYLEGRGINPKMVIVVRSQTSQLSKRYAFAWFESVSDADKAVDLPNPIMRNRPLTIQHSFKKKFKNA